VQTEHASTILRTLFGFSRLERERAAGCTAIGTCSWTARHRAGSLCPLWEVRRSSMLRQPPRPQGAKRQPRPRPLVRGPSCGRPMPQPASAVRCTPAYAGCSARQVRTTHTRPRHRHRSRRAQLHVGPCQPQYSRNGPSQKYSRFCPRRSTSATRQRGTAPSVRPSTLQCSRFGQTCSCQHTAAGTRLSQRSGWSTRRTAHQPRQQRQLQQHTAPRSHSRTHRWAM
jgi:hypothetical protein